MTDDPSPAPPKRRKFWQRWITDPVMRQLTQGVTPERIALSVAVGSALAVFPILGTTTTLCVVAGVVLKLNQPLIQGVNALCTIVYFPLMIGFLWLGDTFTGSPHQSLNIPHMISLASNHPSHFFHEFGVTALHAVMGWAAVAPFWVPGVYLLVLPPLAAAARRLGKQPA